MKSIKRTLTLLFIFILATIFVGASPASKKQITLSKSNSLIEPEYSNNRVIVTIDEEKSLEFYKYSPQDFSEISCTNVINLTETLEEKTKGLLLKGELIENIKFNQILCLEIENEKNNVIDAISILKEKENILCAEPDYVMTSFSTTPNDTYYSEQWAVLKIDLPYAWDMSTGSTSVKVGVIDSGIDGTHPDLASNLDTSLSRSFLTGSAVYEYPTDPFGHGTMVAGIIGAKGNNNTGVTGASWNVKLVSLRILDDEGYGCSSSAIAAISYSESIELPILNISSGWYTNNIYWNSSVSSISTAISNFSGLLICAAGNQNVDMDLTTNGPYPQMCLLNNMLIVGASDAIDTKWSDSNYGNNVVDLFAPGVSVLTTYPTSKCVSGTHDASTHQYNGYHSDTGTSLAAPYVTGVAALIKSMHSSADYYDMKHAILDYGDYITSLSSYCFDGIRLNAYRALNGIHSYSYIDYGNPDNHRCICSECGLIVYKPHNWTLAYGLMASGNNRYIPMFYCSNCGAFSLNPNS